MYEPDDEVTTPPVEGEEIPKEEETDETDGTEETEGTEEVTE